MTDWKDNGVKVIPGDSLDTNTAQSPGMNRAAAINFACWRNCTNSAQGKER